ncbi:MAG TPA: BamA/TamA family outer membrane protein, partial [Rhodothermales bacterium]|nr:BamA/TamA family outer membrane protein [Rhodothermales bacterium]
MAEDIDNGSETLPPDSTRTYQVFLLGNTGGNTPDDAPVLQLLQPHLNAADTNSTLVFLGDNLFGKGLPDSAQTGRAEAEARLRAYHDQLQNFPGRIVFVPGDQDWQSGGKKGLNAVNRQEAFLETLFPDRNVFLPDFGFGGPIEIDLTEHLTLVVLDTQWWLHPYDKSYGDAGEYDLDEDGDLLVQLDDVIKDNRQNHLLVVGHHPLFSNGEHAGFVPAHDHLLPLPLIESIKHLYRRYIGQRQDLAHERYRSLRRQLKPLFEQHENLIYAAAHDHSLQYFPVEEQHYLVSGAGSQANPVAAGHGAAFTTGQLGWMTLHYYDDGSVWLEAHVTDEGNPARVFFRTQLAEPDPERIDLELPPATTTTYPDYSDSTAVVKPNPDAQAGALRRFFLGDLHRDAWTASVRVPYIDLGTEAGGLTPVKRGGGLQTTSLRLEGADGKEYVLRSVKKDPAKALPDDFRNTIAKSITRDLAAAQHPFGAYIVPPLADAVGVHHTNPRPVYLPNDPRLGIYQETIGGQLMLFEERPDDDQSDAPYFGNSSEVVGSPEMFRKVTDDNDHRVDQRMFARARLFDMLLSDWDRHADQWRWATFEPYELDSTLVGEAREQGKIYQPIPRDRDAAFNWFDGFFSVPAKAFTKYQDFRKDYGNLRGLTTHAWELDHRFLADLDRTDWIAIADSMKAALTDEIIEDAVRRWPEVFFEQKGKQFIEILKIRRDKLPRVAEKFYKLHARSVDIVGSHKHERFEVRRLNDDETEVVMYKTSKEGEIRREIYRRTFHRNETREILLYGFGGNDTFEVTGKVNDGILIAAIGGPGEDTFIDQSKVSGWGKKTRFYDTKDDNDFSPSPETRVLRSDTPDINRYDPTLRYNVLAPTPVFGSDGDNGLIFGAGIRAVRHGLRKEPYATAHLLTASYAIGANAFAAAYHRHRVADFGGWDRTLDVTWKGPNSIRNFFGFGNETVNEEDRLGATYNQTRLMQFTFTPRLEKIVANGITVRFGPRLETDQVQPDRDRLIGQFVNSRPPSFDQQWRVGLEAGLELASVDRTVNPRQGLRWTNHTAIHTGLGNTDDRFLTLSSEAVLYVSPLLRPQITLAVRAGVAHLIGDTFPYFYASTLGGSDNLRGFRNHRFAGRTSTFQNVELRLGLLNFSTYVALGEVGLLGFFDNGRVWADDLPSNEWHQGYGGGVWFTFFNRLVLTGTYGLSDDEQS